MLESNVQITSKDEQVLLFFEKELVHKVNTYLNQNTWEKVKITYFVCKKDYDRI